MKNHYLLWATGEDCPGIVAGISKILFQHNCNIQDSSMMRLGSEFGVLLIFSSKENFSIPYLEKTFGFLSKKLTLSLGIKKITEKQARFQKIQKPLVSVSVHGIDRPGIVYEVTKLLAREKFNITDLSTHQTTNPKNPGFILIIEGEVHPATNLKRFRMKINGLGQKISTKISVNELSTLTF